MQERQLNNVELIDLAEDIFLRHAVHAERAKALLSLSMDLKFGVVWRTNLYSNTAAVKLHDFLRQKNHDLELIMSMTNEFVYRSGLNFQTQETNAPNVITSLARSLTWPSRSQAQPKEVINLTAKMEDYRTVLQSEPWALFLYLSSMSSVIHRLQAVK